MSRIERPPPKLTPDLTRAIEDRVTDARQGSGPVSPLDWVASRAGVKKQTLKRWMRRAVGIRSAGITGPIAGKWIRFADAVDALVSECANSVCESIGEIAADTENKKRLDALLAVQRRLDRHEADLDAVDLDVDQDQSVAHIPQEIMDRLTDDQLADLLRAEEMIIAAVALRERILSAADLGAGEISDPADPE
jgi:hypothetical protein